MDYVFTEDYDAMCKAAAQKIADTIRREVKAKGKAVIGLATGSTPIGIYKELVRMHKEEGLSFKNVVTFNLDEYIVRDREDFFTHPQSYHGFMRQHLFDHVDIRPENIHIPNTLATNLKKECEDYEQAIRKEGGIDLQLLGIGPNGHIGFCEPGSAINGRTSIFDLTDETINANERKFGFCAKQAVSMGLGTIMEAKEIVQVANGAEKMPILRAAARGVVSENYLDGILKIPALILKRHPNATLIVDKAAGEQMLIKPEELHGSWSPQR